MYSVRCTVYGVFLVNQKCANASENDENPCGVRGCRNDATKVHRGCRKDARKMHREEGEKQEREKQESGLAAALFEKMNWLELPLVVGLDSRV